MAVVPGRNWPIDPDVKGRSGGGGSPPKHHLRRCQGSKRNGDQCPFWAARRSVLPDGSGYCKRHGGHHPLTHQKASDVGLYSYRASAKLKDLLARAKDGGSKERLDLAEELDLARILCERNIRLFDAACLDPETSKNVKPHLKVQAMKGLEASIKLVADLTASYAKLLVVSDEVFNAAQMDYIIKGLTDVLAAHLEDNPELIGKIIEDVGKLCAPEKKGRDVNIVIG